MSRRNLHDAPGSRIMVAVDGSSLSILAAEEACGFSKAESDRVWAVTVDDPDKDYLPDEFVPKHIEKDCRALFGAMPEGSYTFEAPELRGATDTVWSVLRKTYGETLARFFFCGAVGRKGPKLARTVLGRVADAALRGLPTTTVVVKKKSPVRKGIMCCLDGSGRAFSALDQLLRLTRDSTHEVLLVHVVAADGDRADWADGVEHKSMEIATDAPGMEPIDLHYVKLECATRAEVGPLLLAHAAAQKVDYLMVGADGLGMAEPAAGVATTAVAAGCTGDGGGDGDGGGVGDGDGGGGGESRGGGTAADAAAVALAAAAAPTEHGTDREAVLGRVADLLVRHAPCNVMVCNVTEDEYVDIDFD